MSSRGRGEAEAERALSSEPAPAASAVPARCCSSTGRSSAGAPALAIKERSQLRTH